MRYQESQRIELRREYTAELKKEVVAFANSDGGTIYIGIDDDGTVVGVAEPDRISLQVMNMIRDSIKPDVTMITACEAENVENKTVIRIEVQRGTLRPYYIAEKGLKPSGVYLRQGTASAPASDNAIRQMIKETDGDKFETARSLQQTLTFDAMEREFEKRGLELGGAQMQTLGLLTAENVFTNLGLLLSDQCVHTIKVAVFSGADKSEFKDRREFSGSLLKQLVNTYEYIDLVNQTRAEFVGLERIDHRDYPEAALREALLNALVHRDYAFSGSTLINIFRNKIEFVSLGGLVSGLTAEDLLLGISQTRNEKLAAVFYRLKLIEAYGTGIIKIMDSYRTAPVKPELQVTANAFLLTLPNVNQVAQRNGVPDPEQIILQHVATHSVLTRKEAEKLLGLSQTAAGNVLKDLTARKLLKTVGAGKNTRYVKP